MKENQFTVDLGDLKLDDDQRLKINASIQKAVAGELASLNLRKSPVLIPINKFPNFPIWYGIIARDFDKVIIKDSIKFQ